MSCILATRESYEASQEYHSHENSLDLTMSHQDKYRQWPFLIQEEFDLVCAYTERRYIRAKLGPTRQVFKLRCRRHLTTCSSYLEIIRVLKRPEDEDELSLAFEKLGRGGESDIELDVEMDMPDEDADSVSCTLSLSDDFRSLFPYLPHSILIRNAGGVSSKRNSRP